MRSWKVGTPPLGCSPRTLAPPSTTRVWRDGSALSWSAPSYPATPPTIFATPSLPIYWPVRRRSLLLQSPTSRLKWATPTRPRRCGTTLTGFHAATSGSLTDLSRHEQLLTQGRRKRLSKGGTLVSVI